MRLAAALAGALIGGCALAADEVALVNHLAGSVSHIRGSRTEKAKPYMKLREGDRLNLIAGAQLRVVYLQAGRLESYSGPAAFTVGRHESSVQGGVPPQVSVLPSGVPQKIAQAQDLVAIAKIGRTRGASARGPAGDKRLTPQQQAEVRQARLTYDELRRSSAADDITPEFYLYSVLQDNLLFNDMKPVVAEMQKRQPENPDVAAMADYVKVKTAPRK